MYGRMSASALLMHTTTDCHDLLTGFIFLLYSFTRRLPRAGFFVLFFTTTAGSMC
jgi:hypothetical protein